MLLLRNPPLLVVTLLNHLTVNLMRARERLLHEYLCVCLSSIKHLVTDIVRVFVDAAPHVPPHRRLPLFSHLLSTVGPQDYLYVALGLLVEKHVVLPTGKELVCEHTLHSDTAEQLHCSCANFPIIILYTIDVR